MNIIIYKAQKHSLKIEKYLMTAETELSVIAKVEDWKGDAFLDYEMALPKSEKNTVWFENRHDAERRLQDLKAERIAEIENQFTA